MAEAHRRASSTATSSRPTSCWPADGTPKITDFGLAKWLDADSGSPQSDAIMGSPSYMAPEQAEGKTRRLGRSPTSTRSARSCTSC